MFYEGVSKVSERAHECVAKQIELKELCERTNERSERPGGLLKTRLSVTRNAPMDSPKGKPSRLCEDNDTKDLFCLRQLSVK